MNSYTSELHNIESKLTYFISTLVDDPRVILADNLTRKRLDRITEHVQYIKNELYLIELQLAKFNLDIPYDETKKNG